MNFHVLPSDTMLSVPPLCRRPDSNPLRPDFRHHATSWGELFPCILNSCYKREANMSQKHIDRKVRFAGLVAAKEQAAENQEMQDMFGPNPRSFRQHGKSASRITSFNSKPPKINGYSPELSAWRLLVLHRDGNRCVFCSSTERLEADHIKPRALYPDLQFDVDNGRTLCHSCHVQTETYGGKIRRLISVDSESVA